MAIYQNKVLKLCWSFIVIISVTCVSYFISNLEGWAMYIMEQTANPNYDFFIRSTKLIRIFGLTMTYILIFTIPFLFGIVSEKYDFLKNRFMVVYLGLCNLFTLFIGQFFCMYSISKDNYSFLEYLNPFNHSLPWDNFFHYSFSEFHKGSVLGFLLILFFIYAPALLYGCIVAVKDDKTENEKENRIDLNKEII